MLKPLLDNYNVTYFIIQLNYFYVKNTDEINLDLRTLGQCTKKKKKNEYK